MATIQLGNTKVANRLISYAEERAEVQEGVDCSPEYAKAQFKAIRELWGKNDGIQAHHVIQSFKPGEVTPEQANEIGQELAKEIAKGHEAVVYTHTDKDHIHNHIVINSVSFEDGKKYQSTKKDLYNIREVSDRLCLERGLSVVTEPYAKERSHRAEHGLAEKEVMSWKQEVRTAINFERKESNSYEEFKENLAKNYDIQVKERGKNITYIHPNGRKVRGSTLGNDYDKETLKREFTREIQSKRESSQERGNSHLSYEQSRGSERAERVAEANNRFERSNEELHQNTHGQVNSREDDLRQRNRQYQDHKQTDNDGYALDTNEARKNLEQ